MSVSLVIAIARTLFLVLRETQVGIPMSCAGKPERRCGLCHLLLVSAVCVMQMALSLGTARRVQLVL